MSNDFVKFLSTLNCAPDAPIYAYCIYLYVVLCMYILCIHWGKLCNMVGDTSPMPTAHSDLFPIFKFGKLKTQYFPKICSTLHIADICRWCKMQNRSWFFPINFQLEFLILVHCGAALIDINTYLLSKH